MTIDETEAIAAARAYADTRNQRAWREGTVGTTRVVVEGHDCWRITAADALLPGETWLDEEIDGGQSYLVDVTTGECIGIGLLNGYHLFIAQPVDRKARPARRSRHPGWRGLLDLLRVRRHDR